jgi:folate-dependent phosphoribosylglycinamide formyltransferase PurN
MKKNVVFLGTRLETLSLLDIFFNVNQVITTKDSFISHNYKKNKIILINKKNKEEIFKKILLLKSSILISAGFPYIIPELILKKFKIVINCHPGKLPEYKGYYSLDLAKNNNENFYYSTIHYMNKKVDSGKKILELKFSGKNMTLNEIQKIMFGFIEPHALFLALRKIYLI